MPILNIDNSYNIVFWYTCLLINIIAYYTYEWKSENRTEKHLGKRDRKKRTRSGKRYGELNDFFMTLLHGKKQLTFFECFFI